MFLENLRNRISQKARLARFETFKKLLETFDKPATILDLGGTQEFWEHMACTDKNTVNITLLNIAPQHTSLPNFKSLTGDASDLSQFNNQQFDIVFSNSVIEHLGSRNNQDKMAHETERVGKSYFIQTPNYWFPLEPHVNVVGFQYLPTNLRVWLLSKFDLGHYTGLRQKELARQVVNELQLLKPSEMRELFPYSTLLHERFLGLSKSIMCVKLPE